MKTRLEKAEGIKRVLFKEYLITDEPKLSDAPVQHRYTPQSMEVVYKFGDWLVDAKGNLCYKKHYFIDKSSLKDSDLICHLFSKGWIDWNEFIPAYFTACKINKIEHLSIRTFYKSALNE